MSHGTHVNESWHTCEWVMAHMWMSHGTQVNESWHTYEWVMAHVWMRHGTHMKESWHTYERVTAHIWTNYGTHMNELWHTYKWVMVHKWIHGQGRARMIRLHLSLYAWKSRGGVFCMMRSSAMDSGVLWLATVIMLFWNELWLTYESTRALLHAPFCFCTQCLYKCASVHMMKIQGRWLIVVRLLV